MRRPAHRHPDIIRLISPHQRAARAAEIAVVIGFMQPQDRLSPSVRPWSLSRSREFTFRSNHRDRGNAMFDLKR
jgi:hypothetical protein